MNAVLVEAEEQETGGFRGVAGNQIIGQNVSSLHRLKDIDNKGRECIRVLPDYVLIQRVRWWFLRLR